MGQPHNQPPHNQPPHNQQPHNQQPHNQQPHNQQPHNQQPHNQQPLKLRETEQLVSGYTGPTTAHPLEQGGVLRPHQPHKVDSPVAHETSLLLASRLRSEETEQN
ncbi:hypothetical protein FHG87_019503 [Trinorchestia longiramus]|nr:hypothetical protein FHG87_019503 [Trinorchestia longiramus]